MIALMWIAQDHRARRHVLESFLLHLPVHWTLCSEHVALGVGCWSGIAAAPVGGDAATPITSSVTTVTVSTAALFLAPAL